MKRSEIYKVIDGERRYQAGKWGADGSARTEKSVRYPGGTTVCSEDGSIEQYKTVGEFLTYMRHYLSLADKAASEEEGDLPALEVMRKVVTLGVACFEQHGVPPRS